MTLPRPGEFPSRPAAPETPKPDVVKMAVTKTVLLADDEDDIVQAMKAVLEHRGYRVVIAADGNMGLAVAEQEAPDLAVVDMMMPRTNGFLVLEHLKRRPNGGPPVIMITGNGGPRHRAYAQTLGADDFILKPFPMERLLESVRRLCPLGAVAAHR